MAYELQPTSRQSPSYQRLVDGKKHPAPSRQQHRNMFQGWFWELSAAIVSWACLAAVFAILSRMQDQATRHWLFPISINSTIAAFVTAIKSLCMLVVASCLGQSKWSYFEHRSSKLRKFEIFDEASRGPEGSLRLLWCLRGRWNLALFGALITIGAVSVDSLAQGLINTDETRPEFTNKTVANVWFAHSYKGGAKSIAGAARIEDLSFDTNMRRAIIRGMYGIPSSAPFECPSKCVWEGPYIALGFRSSCDDVTASAFAGMQYNYITDPEGGSGTALLSTPNGVVVNYTISFTSFRSMVDVATIYHIPSTSASAKFDPLDPTFARIGIFRLKHPDADVKGNELSPDNAEVYECQMRYVAYEYRHIEVNGTDLRIMNESVHELNPGTYEKSDDDLTNIVFNSTSQPAFAFKVRREDYEALGHFLNSSSFSGKSYAGESKPPEYPGLSPIFLGADLNETFANATRSMTNQLHAGTPDDVTTERGLAEEAVVVAQVSWPWIAAPLTLAAATTVLLVATMWSSRHDTLWKSSAIAVLYHEVGPPDAPDTVLRASVGSVEGLKRLGKDVRIRYAK